MTLVCVGAGYWWLDLGLSAKALANTPFQAWLAVIFCSLLMAGLRALRVVVVARTDRIVPVISASFLHGAANAVLPARLGEAVLPLALSRYAGLKPMRAIGLLLIVRLGDLIALAGLGLLLVAALDTWSLVPEGRIALAVLGAALIAAIGAVPFLVRLLGRWAPGFVGSLANGIAAAGTRLGSGSHAALVILTLAIWLALGVAAYVSIAAMALTVDFALAWLACIAASLAFALPTNGIASIGPFEAAFAGVLIAGGASAEAALAAAVHLHLCALIAAGLTAAVGFVLNARPTARSRSLVH